MKIKPDLLDKKLVSLLAENAQQSSEKIAEKLNVSSATVRRRLKILLQNGLLRIVGVVNPPDFGYPLATIMTLNVEKKRVYEIVKELSTRREIRWISTTTGLYSIILGASFGSLDYLSDFLKIDIFNIEGIKDIETFICLKEWIFPGNYLSGKLSEDIEQSEEIK